MCRRIYWTWYVLLMTLKMSSSPGIVSPNFWTLSEPQLRPSFPKSAFPKTDSNLFEWVGTIEGAPGTVSQKCPQLYDVVWLSSPQIYAGLTYKISINFPPNYPYVPPVIKFESPCFHPNVDLAGNICLDILRVWLYSIIYHILTQLFLLQEKWSAIYSVHSILISLQSLLGGKVSRIWYLPALIN